MLKKVFISLAVILQSGCNTILLGSYGAEHQTLEAFAKRVENVFRFENSMTNAVMLCEEPSEDLLVAEKEMHAACESLNEYASREVEGESADFDLQKRVEQTAIGCEKAAQQLQTLLSLLKESK